MKHLCQILLFLFLSSSSTLVFGQEYLTLDNNELKDIYHELLSKDAPWPKENLTLVNFQAKPSPIKLPLGTIEFHPITNSSTKVLGNQTRSIIISVDGVAQAKIKMRGTMQLMGPVVILKQNTPRNSIITANDIEVIHRDITMLPQDILTNKDDAINQELKTSLKAGAFLFKRNLKLRALVHRGDLVTIQAKSGSLQVRASGEAKSPGVKGQLIQVKNLASRKIITATVVGEGLVEVDF